jgi:nucleosome binding factor SPN SPT16 subunit
VYVPLQAHYICGNLSAGFEELVPKLSKSVGHGTGLELRESRLQLTATNDTRAEAKMVFNVSVGVQDLSNPDATDDKDKTYAIQVSRSFSTNCAACYCQGHSSLHAEKLCCYV